MIAWKQPTEANSSMVTPSSALLRIRPSSVGCEQGLSREDYGEGREDRLEAGTANRRDTPLCPAIHRAPVRETSRSCARGSRFSDPGRKRVLHQSVAP